MNERIKQLSEQADAFARETVAYYRNEHDEYPHKLYDISREKFAELIVRECMKCGSWVGEVNKNPVEPIHTAHAINKRIKEHFGIKDK